MIAPKSKKKVDVDKLPTTWPIVTVGSHSTRYEYEDGRVELVTDWDALKRDVREAIAGIENKTEEKSKRTRKK